MESPNRLNGTRSYLSGSIDQATDYGLGWRQQITPILQSKGIIVLDPCNKPVADQDEVSEQVKLRHQLKKEGKYDEVRNIMRKIRSIDLRMVDISDFLIVRLDLNIPSCGTVEEITTANRSKKPIIIWCEQGKSSINDWYYAMCPHEMFFDNLEEVIKYIDYIDNDPSPELYRRWVFFDYTKI